jgi:hypothetical protein
MAKKKEWREGEMILTFKLNKIERAYTKTMTEWLNVAPPQFESWEQQNFEKTYEKGLKKLQYWSEENLKMHSVG